MAAANLKRPDEAHLYTDWVKTLIRNRAVKRLTDSQTRLLHQLLSELDDRASEALNIYEPLPKAEEFHRCGAIERIIRGSNRSGKSLTSAVEMARALCGADPHGKYPERGKMIICGKDGRHLSDPLYNLLFKVGDTGRMIKDEKTGRWRNFRPWTSDKERVDEAVPWRPLIPPRLIEYTSWEKKVESMPSLTILRSGWEIKWFSSNGKPPQGIKVDVAWFDEEIVDSDWYTEVAARLVDKEGLFVWSATAQKGGMQLYDLCERAHAERTRPEPAIVEFFMHIDENQYFTDAMREKIFAKLTPEQIRIRIEGEFAYTSYRVYPEFDERTCGVDWFMIPSDWTRYVAIDPGRQVGGALFLAVPPPSYEDPLAVFVYDEIFLRNCDVEQFAREMKKRSKEQQFHVFLIDHQGGQLRGVSGLNWEDQYAYAFKQHNITSARTGSNFIWGNPDEEAGIEKLRSWLLPRDNGIPKLRYFPDKCPNFTYQMKRYHYQRKRDHLTDKASRVNCDLCDCLRYLAMYEPEWYRPVNRSRSATIWNTIKNQRQAQSQQYVSLGGGASRE